MYQAVHYELVASALAVKVAREINPALQIGCMIAMCPIYPLTCAPNDMMMAMNAMHRRYWFTDVHVRGKYPQHLLNYFTRRGFELDITEEDRQALTEGCVDYIGFSYYMSFATQQRRTTHSWITTSRKVWFPTRMCRNRTGAGRLIRLACVIH